METLWNVGAMLWQAVVGVPPENRFPSKPAKTVPMWSYYLLKGLNDFYFFRRMSLRDVSVPQDLLTYRVLNIASLNLSTTVELVKSAETDMTFVQVD